MPDVRRGNRAEQDEESGDRLHESEGGLRGIGIKSVTDGRVQPPGGDRKRRVGGGVLCDALKLFPGTAAKEKAEVLTTGGRIGYT